MPHKESLTNTEILASMPKDAVVSIDGLPYPKVASGKVREIFDAGDALLMVATDRLSAFDVILGKKKLSMAVEL